MADDLDSQQNAGDAARRDPKISKKAMRRLDDDVIVKILLRPDREERERSWWRRLLQWLTKRRGSSDFESD